MASNVLNNLLGGIQLNLLSEVADLKAVPTTGAFNIRVDGQSAARNTTSNINIITKRFERFDVMKIRIGV